MGGEEEEEGSGLKIFVDNGEGGRGKRASGRARARWWLRGEWRVCACVCVDEKWRAAQAVW